MISLDDIYKYIPAERTILFEEGLWCIYRRQDPGMFPTSYAIHRCSHKARALENNRWVCGNNGDHLSEGCGEKAPDSIITLLTIHKWER